VIVAQTLLVCSDFYERSAAITDGRPGPERTVASFQLLARILFPEQPVQNIQRAPEIFKDGFAQHTRR